MKIKKILSILSVCVVTASIFAGCQNINSTSSKNNSTNDKPIEELSDEGEVSEVEKKIDLKASKDDISNNVDYLVSAMYNLSSKFNYITELFNSDLRALADNLQDGEDILNENIIEKGNSETVKGFLRDCKLNNLKMYYDSQNFYVRPKLDYVIEKYGQYINDNTKDILVFRNDEDVNSIFNNGTGTFNLELTTTKILKIEAKTKDTTNKYYNEWLSYLEYYYDAMFGYSHSIFIKDENTQEILSSVVEEYNKIITNNPNSQLAKDLKGYLDIIEKNKNCRNDESQKYLSSLFSERFATISSSNYEEDSQILEQQDNTTVQGESTQVIEP